MMPKLIVASNSARRQQLMKEAGFQFEVKTLEVDETIGNEIAPSFVAEYLAKKKNDAYRRLFTDEVVLTADTIVIADNKILGKPGNEHEAFDMLTLMSGKTHEVVSGVCISSPAKTISFDDTTKVDFENISNEEMEFYIKNYQPYDKAGSYGIQEWLGMIGIRSIHGSYYNVMGLPIHKVYRCLKSDFGMTPIKA